MLRFKRYRYYKICRAKKVKRRKCICFNGTWLVICLLVFWGCGISPPTSKIETDLVYVTVTPVPTATALPAFSRAVVDLDQLEGGWGGEFKFESQAQWTLIVAEFVVEAPSLTVLITFPLDETLTAVSSSVELGMVGEVAAIRFGVPFQLAGQQATLTFDGLLEGDKIVGSIRHGDHSGQFELAPLIDFGPDGFKSRT